MLKPAAAALLLLPALLVTVPAAAQPDPTVQAALAGGMLGERADGYVGFVRPPRAPLRAKVDAINARRRAGYEKAARAQGVTVEAYAASVGCRNLTGLSAGRAYSVGGDAWAVKADAPVALPEQCNAARQ